jgi:hypothetical protein
LLFGLVTVARRQPFLSSNKILTSLADAEIANYDSSSTQSHSDRAEWLAEASLAKMRISAFAALHPAPA